MLSFLDLLGRALGTARSGIVRVEQHERTSGTPPHSKLLMELIPRQWLNAEE